MRVSQQQIASRLGLSRTTVTKILNRDPKYSASKTTREKVFHVAEIMGYDFTTIRRPFKREYGRKEVNTPCELEIYLKDGSLFDRGRAVARNIGVGGALLVELDFPKMALPLVNFVIHLRLNDIPELKHLKAECQVVRLADSIVADQPELGVKFINAGPTDRRLLHAFVESKIEENNDSQNGSRAEKPLEIPEPVTD